MKRCFLAFGILIAVPSLSQNVGIGTSSPAELLDVNGNTQTKNLRIPNFGSIDLGYGLPGKEVNAGRIGYGLFTANAVDMVGGGSGTDNRRIRFWAEAGSVFTGGASFSGNVGVGLASNANGKLEIHGRGGRAHNLALLDSVSFSAGSLLFANISRPGSGLMIRGNSFGSAASQNQLHIVSGDGNSLLLSVRGDGKVGILQPNPVYTLDVGGDLNLTGALYTDGSAGTAGKVLQSNGSASPGWVSPTASQYRNIYFDTLSANIAIPQNSGANLFTKFITLTDSAWVILNAEAYFSTVIASSGYAELTISSINSSPYTCRSRNSLSSGSSSMHTQCALRLPAGSHTITVVFDTNGVAAGGNILKYLLRDFNGVNYYCTSLRTEIIYR